MVGSCHLYVLSNKRRKNEGKGCVTFIFQPPAEEAEEERTLSYEREEGAGSPFLVDEEKKKGVFTVGDAKCRRRQAAIVPPVILSNDRRKKKKGGKEVAAII